MTDLEKPVFRVTRGAYPVLRSKPMRIVVGLEPGDMITFREKRGRRRKWALPVDQVFRMAVKGEAGFLLCMVPGPSLRKKRKAAS